MGRWADSANSRSNLRHVFGRSPLREAFETAQFRNLEVRPVDGSVIVQYNIYFAVPFEAGYGIYYNMLSHGYFPP
jgi:hypothetical protein